MEAKGKGILKVVSILFIIFGAISIVVSIIAIAGTAVISSMGGGTGGLIGGTIILIISSVGMLVIGIVGLKKCADVSAAMFFIVTGIIFCVLNLVSMILSFQVTSLIGFVLPVLYIVGGFLNKNSA